MEPIFKVANFSYESVGVEETQKELMKLLLEETELQAGLHCIILSCCINANAAFVNKRQWNVYSERSYASIHNTVYIQVH